MSDHRPIRNTTGANHDPHLVHRAQHLHTTIYNIYTLSTHTTLIYIKYPVCVWAGAMISLITMFWWSHYMCNVYIKLSGAQLQAPLYTAPSAGGETSADTAEDGGYLPQLRTPLNITQPMWCGDQCSGHFYHIAIVQWWHGSGANKRVSPAPEMDGWWPVPDSG